MTQFDFYKKRDFGSYLSDSFAFIKMYFSNFFKNALIINGSIILIFAVIGSIISYTIKGGADIFSFMRLNPLLFFLLGILFLVGILLIYSFPITYFKICENSPERNNFSTSEILEKYFSIAKRNFLFLFFCLFTILPLFIFIPIAFSLVFDFVIKKIGFLMAIPIFIINSLINTLLTIFITQASILFVKDNEKFFKSITKSFNLLKNNLLHKMGATFVMGIIIYMLSLTTGIVFIGLLALGFLGLESGVLLSISTFVSLLMLFISLFFVLPLLTLSLQMMIHYSDKYQDKIFIEIDQIGNNN